MPSQLKEINNTKKEFIRLAMKGFNLFDDFEVINIRYLMHEVITKWFELGQDIFLSKNTIRTLFETIEANESM